MPSKASRMIKSDHQSPILSSARATGHSTCPMLVLFITPPATDQNGSKIRLDKRRRKWFYDRTIAGDDENDCHSSQGRRNGRGRQTQEPRTRRGGSIQSAGRPGQFGSERAGCAPASAAGGQGRRQSDRAAGVRDDG